MDKTGMDVVRLIATRLDKERAVRVERTLVRCALFRIDWAGKDKLRFDLMWSEMIAEC